MKKDKTVLILALVVLMLCFQAAAQAKSLSIGMILWRGETDADRALAKTLTSEFPDTAIQQINVDQNIRKTVETLQQTWKPLLKTMDYVFSFGSRNSLQVRKELIKLQFPGTHIAFGNSSQLEEAHQKRQITGERLLLGQTSLPRDAFFAAFGDLIEMKTVAVPYNLHEPQNLNFLEELIELAKERNIKVVPIRTKPERKTLKNQLERAFNQIDKIDVLYFPLDSFMLSNAEILLNCSVKFDAIPIGANKKYISAGIPLGLDSDYAFLGTSLAKQVIAIENGQQLSLQPIVRNATGKIVANRKSLEALLPGLSDKLPQDTQFIN